ncbi:MAG: hypothetical protein PHX62_02835 [Bacilli bacterium]|nr:hypothetical protein [Bacilli bacterium]
MTELYDKNKIIILEKDYKRKKNFFFVTLAITMIILLINTLMRTDESHILFLVLNIIITIFSGWYLIAYSFIIKQTKDSLLFYKKVFAGNNEELVGQIIEIEEKPYTINNHQFYQLLLKLENRQERLLYWDLEVFQDIKTKDKIKVRIVEKMIVAYALKETHE